MTKYLDAALMCKVRMNEKNQDELSEIKRKLSGMTQTNEVGQKVMESHFVVLVPVGVMSTLHQRKRKLSNRGGLSILYSLCMIPNGVQGVYTGEVATQSL